jgi:hypothetical protein
MDTSNLYKVLLSFWLLLSINLLDDGSGEYLLGPSDEQEE